MALQFRRGNEADLDKSKLLAAEPAYAIDSDKVFIGDGAGTAFQLAKQSDLDLKANSIDVNTQVAAVASGSPKAVYATLSALQAAYPSGTTGIYVVTADGKWYYWYNSAWTAGGTYQSTGIGDGAISPSKTSFIKTSNLFDASRITTGGFYNSGGTWISSADYESVELPDVLIGRTYYYYASGLSNTHITYWDKNNAYITGEQQSASNNLLSFTVPNLKNIVKVRLLVLPAWVSSSIITIDSSIPILNSPQGVAYSSIVHDELTEFQTHVPTVTDLLIMTQLFSMDIITRVFGIQILLIAVQISPKLTKAKRIQYPAL